MDFGRRQLEKYGWKIGQGLGKNENGIAQPLKPKLKFDNHGIGHNIAEEFTDNWWENVYNNATNNVVVNNSDGTVNMKLHSNKSVEITSKLNSGKRKFIKTSKLTADGIIDLKTPEDGTQRANNNVSSAISIVSDEELFAACGGRTAHKGARHGIKQSGKLSRIEKQEKLLLKKLKNVSISDDKSTVEKKVKKLYKHKEKCYQTRQDGGVETISDEMDSLSSCGSNTPRKKKKNKRRVSFNETVTEYHISELDSTAKGHSDIEHEKVEQCSGLGDFNVNNVGMPQNDGVISHDEGIEQDLDPDSACFEFIAFDAVHLAAADSLSKEERKLLKKKRKSLKKNTATMRFLEESCPSDGVESIIDNESKCKKRKLKFEPELDIMKKKAHSDHKYNLEGVKYKLDKKEKKRIKRDEKQINSIVKSMNNSCRINDMESG